MGFDNSVETRLDRLAYPAQFILAGIRARPLKSPLVVHCTNAAGLVPSKSLNKPVIITGPRNLPMFFLARLHPELQFA